MMIEYRQAEKIFKENNIRQKFDGIGNSTVYYVDEDGREIAIGGYVDSEPFKTRVATAWKVECSYGSIWIAKEKHIEWKGYYWVSAMEDEFCDSEFIDAILAAKDELLKVLPELKRISAEICENFNSVQIDSSISPTHNGMYHDGTFIKPKWVASLNWKGKQFVGEPRDSYLEAKEDHDRFIKQAVEEEQNEK